MALPTRFVLILCLLLGATLPRARAGAVPPPPAPDVPVKDVLTHAAPAPGAATPLKAMWGTAPARATRLGDSNAFELPCNFKGTTFERATWDAMVKLDLTTARGVQFQFYAPPTAAISYFSVYMHSGNGWYATQFGPDEVGAWTTVSIDKSQTQIEGQPAGWGSIDTIRVSAWRGKDENASFYLANLGAVGTEAPLMVVRGESAAAAAPSEAESIRGFAKTMTKTLDSLGLAYGVISDLDVTPARLQGKKIIILPYNPSMPKAVSAAIVGFVKGGGKVLTFYTLNPDLARAIGVKTGGMIRGKEKGLFASIRATDHKFTGMPAAALQASWGIHHAEPLDAQTQVAALWFNERGESTGEPAILASDRGVHMTHVMLSDDSEKKKLLLLAMLGRLDRATWDVAAQSRLKTLGRFGDFKGYENAVEQLRSGAAKTPVAQAALDEAVRLHDAALAAIKSSRQDQALEQIGQAHAALIRAYAAQQEPLSGERRGWWCHSAFGVAGLSWDEAIKTLADNGFNVIFPNMLWGGQAYYNSDLLPVAPEVKAKGDQIAECLAACKKYGVECHVWKVNWNMSGHGPWQFVERMQREGRTQVDYKGKAMPWLCPSHPANQQLEIDSMVEVATKYDVDGIHFDYIRYPGADNCFCPGCRERFEKVIGHKVQSWPGDTRYNPTVRAQWLDFRRANITKVVAGVSERVRKERPKVKISAAVFRNWPTDRDSVGQDWSLWCERGYLDFICPMDYTPNAGQFETQIGLQLGWAGKARVYPGIGLSVWDGQSDVVKLMDFIKITRRLKTGGFTVFNYDPNCAREVVPLCGLGITRKN